VVQFSLQVVDLQKVQKLKVQKVVQKRCNLVPGPSGRWKMGDGG
jgi:hypothetical protein